MRGGTALGLMLVALAFALRRRSAHIGRYAPSPARRRRRQRMAQRFAQGFAPAERVERERFMARIQTPLEVERTQWERRVQRAVRVLEDMRGQLRTVRLRVLGLVGAVLGLVALAATADLLTDALGALGVAPHTAALTAAGVLVLLVCLGAVVGESLAGMGAVVRLPAAAAVVGAVVAVAVTVVIVQIVPDDQHRLAAAILPTATTLGALGLVRNVYLLATFVAAWRLRWLRRQVAAIDHQILRQRARYQADVVAAAEVAGVDPQAVGAATQAA